jgi:hypothetical protein
MGLETQYVDVSALCWVAEKSQQHLQDQIRRGLWPWALCRGMLYCLCCGVWLWRNSQDSMRMAVIQRGTQMTLQSSFADNSRTLSQSFYRRPWVWYNSSVIGLSYQSTKRGDSTIHPDKRFKGSEGTTPLWTHYSWLLWSNTLDSFWTTDWHRRRKMWRISLTGLSGPAGAHLVKCRV